jgi:hypothetical protein
MSSRVGTAIPASRSTARSSSAVGFTMSIQTAFSGKSAVSAKSIFFREDSEATYTDNMRGTPKQGSGLWSEAVLGLNASSLGEPDTISGENADDTQPD